MALLCKSKKVGGSARASPVAAPMPKSVSFLEKRECSDCLDCLELAYECWRTFHRWGDLVFIVDVLPVGW